MLPISKGEQRMRLTGRRLGWCVALVSVLLAVGTLLLLSLESGAQQRKDYFSGEVGKFPEELIKLVYAGDKLDKAQRQENELFAQLWAQDVLGAEVKEDVVRLSNAMEHRMPGNRKYFSRWKKILQENMQQPERAGEFSQLRELLTVVLGNRQVTQARQMELLDDFYFILREGGVHTTRTFSWLTHGGSSSVQRNGDDIAVTYEDVDLLCQQGKDSIVIFGTSGRYDPLSCRWEGQGGEVRWLRSGFSADTVNATLTKYRIDMRRSEYTADTVTFTHRQYLSSPVHGRLVDKLLINPGGQMILFPVVETYGSNYEVKSPLEGVSFKGGVIMQGDRLVGTGTPQEPLRFEMERNDTTLIKVLTQRMAFSKATMAADYATVTIYLRGDSLFHSGLRFTYSGQDQVVRIRPSGLKITRAPMYSSYHRMIIYFEELSWKLGDEKMIFGPQFGSSRGQAYFQSDEYFKEQRFDAMMGRDAEHPLTALTQAAAAYGGRTIPIDFVGRIIGANAVDTRRLLMEMAVQGYVLYDVEAQQVTILDRVYSDIDARFKRKDYDAIEFSSTVGSGMANAVLDLDSADLEVYSVERVAVSDSQNVSITPRGRYVRLKKNRDFQFDGVVNVGMFTFTGDSLEFNYNNYSLDLKSVDRVSMRFITDSLDYSGRRAQDRIRSDLEDLTGYVLIDKPDNKAGLVRNEDYPVFTSTKPSKVYYNRPDEGGAAYSKDKLYFQVDTFTFKNMNTFERKDIKFKGTMETGGMLEDFGDTLRLMPDKSLGFIKKTPPEGMPLYGGKARFYDNIMLSNQGLMGDGRLEYKTSTTEAHNFIFYTDSMYATSTSFNLAQEDSSMNSVPDVRGKQHRVRWVPEEDEFWVYKGPEAFQMYRNEADFAGDIVLTSKGLQGRGTVEMRKAKMTSENFTFRRRDWLSEAMSIRFYAEADNSSAFSSDSVRGAVDYDSRTGDFNSVMSTIAGNLDALQYKVYADTLQWPIDKDEIVISTAGVQEALAKGKFKPPRYLDLDSMPMGSIFYSIRPDEDSLYFMSSRATYQFSNPHLQAEGVQYVLSADAQVVVPSMHVDVKVQERMLPFNGATIYADAKRQTHRMYDANVEVRGGESYAGKGKMDYESDYDKAQQLILDSIYVVKEPGVPHTQAYSRVDSAANFHLNSKFTFVGKVTVDANEKMLHYRGGAKPIYSCGLMEGELLSFASRLAPDSLFIPYGPKAKSVAGARLVSGTTMDYINTSPYTAFLTKSRDVQDAELFPVDGLLTYDKTKGRYVLGDKGVFERPDTILHRVELDPAECRLFMDGELALPYDFAQVSAYATGRVTQEIRDSSVSARVFLDLDFFFNSDALKLIANDLAGRETLDNVDQRQEVFLTGLRKRLPYKKFAPLLEQIQLFGATKEPIKELQSTLSLSDVQMVWDRFTRSFVSRGSLGVGAVGGQYVGKRVNGFLEMNKRFGGDYFVLYLEPAPDEFYLFQFTGETMYIVSSNQAMLDLINKVKPNKRRRKADRSGRKYVYTVGTMDEVGIAQKRYRELLK